MGNIEEDFLADAEDDRLTVEFIKNYLPQEVKEKFTEDDLYYFLDVIGEYYVDLLEKTNSEDEVDIDIDAVAEYIAKKAKKEKIGDAMLLLLRRRCLPEALPQSAPAIL